MLGLHSARYFVLYECKGNPSHWIQNIPSTVCKRVYSRAKRSHPHSTLGVESPCRDINRHQQFFISFTHSITDLPARQGTEDLR